MAVVGSASTNSIQRGRLYSASRCAGELLQLERQVGVRRRAGAQRRRGPRLDEPIAILAPVDTARLDRRVLEQRVFDFRGADPDAADLQHVVGAAGKPEEAVLVLPVLVAGPDPVAGNRVLRLFVPVPVKRTRRVALDQQIADLARRDRAAVLVDEPRLVAGDDGTPLEPGRTRPAGSR